MELKTQLRYPDPFQPTGLDIELPSEAIISLHIADDAGNEIAVLVDKKLFSAGKHTIMLNLSNCEVGNYFYRLTLQCDGETLVETKRLVLG